MTKRLLVFALAMSASAAGSFAQQAKPAPSPQPAAVATAKIEIEIPAPSPAITDTTTSKDLARAALTAQGGDRFRQVKTLYITGSADLAAQNMPQVLPAKFSMTYKADKTRLDLKSPLMNILAISDGDKSYSSIKGFTFPSLNKFGTRVLTKYDQPGYVVSDLPNRKKLRAFRITDPDGDATDFFLDPATGRVMTYEYTYMGARSIVEQEKFRIVDGILIPEKFAQRFESNTNMGDMFAEFRVKDVQVNLEVADDVFAIPAQ